MKKPTVSSLKKKLDKVFSLWIRKQYTSHQGYVRCYTCGARKRFNEIQAGHFISRANNSLRYDQRNVKPQCVACNIFKHGNIPEYANHLIDEYGAEIIATLTKEGRQIRQFTTKELDKMIEYYS
jgi:hypothetical protein